MIILKYNSSLSGIKIVKPAILLLRKVNLVPRAFYFYAVDRSNIKMPLKEVEATMKHVGFNCLESGPAVTINVRGQCLISTGECWAETMTKLKTKTKDYHCTEVNKSHFATI